MFKLFYRLYSIHFVLSFLSLFVFTIKKAFPQSFQPQRGRKETFYVNTKRFGTKETHFNNGFKLPVWKGGSFFHLLSMNNQYSNFNNSSMREKFNEDHFYSTDFTWTYIQKKKQPKTIPYTSTLSYRVSGNRFLRNGRNNLSFRFVTGHFSGHHMHSYGAFLASNGAFKGIPLPFYIYGTKIWNQDLILGFPVIKLSGPKENKTNYAFSLSPQGVSLKGTHAFNEKTTLESSWKFDVDNYFIDNEQFSQRESLLVQKQTVAAELRHKLGRGFSFNLSVGREFQKKFFKGQNIFNKDDDKYHIASSNFAQSGLSFSF